MSLFSRTAALGFYRLREGDAVYNELRVYQEVLEPLLARLDALERAPLPALAERTTLERLSVLCGMSVPAGLPEAALRRAIPALLRGAECTATGIVAYLAALGVEGTLSEGADGRVTAAIKEPAGFCPDVETLQRTLARILPAGVGLVLDVGALTWTMFDGIGLTGTQLDAKDFTWAWFDLYGHQLTQ